MSDRSIPLVEGALAVDEQLGGIGLVDLSRLKAAGWAEHISPRLLRQPRLEQNPLAKSCLG